MAQAPVKIPEYVFMWSFLIAFVGSIFFSITSVVSVDPSTLIANKNLSFVINIVIGIAGIVSLFVWFNMDVPALNAAILDQKVVKRNINA